MFIVVDLYRFQDNLFNVSSVYTKFVRKVKNVLPYKDIY